MMRQVAPQCPAENLIHRSSMPKINVAAKNGKNNDGCKMKSQKKKNMCLWHEHLKDVQEDKPQNKKLQKQSYLMMLNCYHSVTASDRKREPSRWHD